MKIGLIDADLYWRDMLEGNEACNAAGAARHADKTDGAARHASPKGTKKKREVKPNVTLMKIAQYHKQLGDEVEWYCGFNERYDKVYIIRDMDDVEISKEIINAEEVVICGMSFQVKARNTMMVWPGWSKEVWDKSNMKMMLKVPAGIEKMEPDWSMYPNVKKGGR